MKKILLIILSLAATYLNASTVSINKTGNGMPIVGEISVSVAPSYYNTCVIKIHARNFGDMAMDGGAYGIVPTQDAFVEMEETLKEAVEEATVANVSNIKDSFSQLKSYMLKKKAFKAQQNTEILIKERELRMEYKAMLKKEVEQAKSTSFGDTDKAATPSADSFTYKMMKNLCKRTKMQDSALGENARKKNIEATSKKAKKSVSKRQKIVSLKSEKRKAQERHYNLFCTPDEQAAGLCEVASALPNGDLQADLFLYPEGFNEENEQVSSYDTKFTYNETEALAADSFIQNVIGFMPVEPPTPEERGNPKKAKFVSLYNQLSSSLNLASFIFERSYQKRLPKNKEGLRMSEMDVFGYMIDDLKSTENTAVENQARGTGFEMLYQSTNALKTKLDMEGLQQKERLKLLEATLLSLEENSAEMLQYLDKIK